MQRGHTLTGHPSTLTPRRKLWTGAAIYLRRKGLNSFFTAQMARFKIPTAMVQIHVRPRTQSINHPSSRRRQQVARTICCFFASWTHTSNSTSLHPTQTLYSDKAAFHSKYPRRNACTTACCSCCCITSYYFFSRTSSWIISNNLYRRLLTSPSPP